jgi:hypothetical protein
MSALAGHRRRLWLPLSLAFALVCATATADEKAACLDAHGSAQILQRDMKLRAAREKLRVCARSSCPSLVTRDCTLWLSEVERVIPTVVFAATDQDGRDVPRARVSMDGELVASEIDGRPIEVDPGDHLFRCEWDGAVVETRAVVRAGEKSRSIAFRRSTPTPQEIARPAPSSRFAIPPASIALGAGAAAALGSFAFFGLTGRARESDLADGCRPNCAQADIDAVRTRYVAADVSLGVAVVALGAALWIALASGSRVQSAYFPRPTR